MGDFMHKQKWTNDLGVGVCHINHIVFLFLTACQHYVTVPCNVLQARLINQNLLSHKKKCSGAFLSLSVIIPSCSSINVFI